MALNISPQGGKHTLIYNIKKAYGVEGKPHLVECIPSVTFESPRKIFGLAWF